MGLLLFQKMTIILQAYKQWENEFQLQLEEKDFDLFLQKDVNNYIAVKNRHLFARVVT